MAAGTVLAAVLGNLLAAGGLAAIAVVAGRWSRRPALGHAVWLLVLVKLVTPPVVAVPVRCLPAEEPALVPRAIPQAAGHAPTVFLSAEPGAIPTPFPTSIDTSSADARPTPVAVSWQAVALAVWLTGSLTWVGVALLRVRRFARLLRLADLASHAVERDVAVVARRLGLKSPPRVRVLPGAVAPFVWAVGRPTLFLPADLLGRLTRDQRDTLIAHELAHLRRRDHVVRWLELLVLAAYWWCPLAWLARRELRRLEEEACDAAVTEAFADGATVYASAILDTLDFLADAAPAPVLASGMGDAASLRRRLVLILGRRRRATLSPGLRLAVAAGGLLVLATGPTLARLAAAVPLPRIDFTAPAPAPTPVTTPADEVGESAQYLPTAVRIAAPSGGGTGFAAAALSPDGTRLAVADGPTVAVWDLAAKAVAFTLTANAGGVNAVAFAPDGRTLATAGNDHFVWLWDAATGRLLRTLAGHTNWVLAAAFAPDGKTLATAGHDRTVRLWDAATGELRATLTGHTAGVRAVAFSPDGTTIASAGADHAVRLWDAAAGTAVVLTGHAAAVRAVAFSPDGKTLATGGDDRAVRLWNATDGRPLGTVPLPDYATALRFSPGGRVLAAGTFGGHVVNVNPATGLARGFVGLAAGDDHRPAHADAVTAVLPTADALFTVGRDRAVFAWPTAGNPDRPAAVFRGHAGGVTAVALSADGRVLATGGRDGGIRLWDAATGTETARLPGHPGGVTAVTFAGGHLVSAGADERVRVWDIATGRVAHTVVQPSADLRIALSPDGGRLAVGGPKLSAVVVWDVRTGAKVRTLGGASAVAFTPDGSRLATGHPDGTIDLWDAGTGEEVLRSAARDAVGPIDGIAFAPDGRTAAVVVNGPADAAGGPVHVVVTWDAADGSFRDAPRPLSHPGPVSAAALAPDGIVTAGHDGNVYLWDAAGRLVRGIRGHADAVTGLAVAGDGAAVFSAGGPVAKRWPMPTSPARATR